jgi:hypothetical protein
MRGGGTGAVNGAMGALTGAEGGGIALGSVAVGGEGEGALGTTGAIGTFIGALGATTGAAGKVGARGLSFSQHLGAGSPSRSSVRHSALPKEPLHLLNVACTSLKQRSSVHTTARVRR